jgi:hypothetical protein
MFWAINRGSNASRTSPLGATKRAIAPLLLVQRIGATKRAIAYPKSRSLDKPKQR